MPDLSHALQNRDLGHLRIIAELWGLELTSTEEQAARDELAAALLDPRLLAETLEILPPETRSALQDLVEADGKMTWTIFTRRFGELREAGPGRRDREHIHRQPTAATEALFYRALLERAFFDTPSGPQEFAYIPDDLLPLIRQSQLVPSPGAAPVQILGRPAAPRERQRPLPVSDRLLDDATTLLAALRTGRQPPETLIPPAVVADFLAAASVLTGKETRPETVRTFLELPRAQALARLERAWRSSESFNELRQVPGLACEGEWTNQPRAVRAFLLDRLEALPAGQWWSLPGFLHDLKEKHPDFQRPAGGYDSWFIKRLSDGTFLRGFAAWDEVDGALVRYLISGPLFWLGRIELAALEQDGPVTAFRWLAKPAAGSENGRLRVASNGQISVPRQAARAVRYLVSRFCEWEEQRAELHLYRVSPQSLKAAGQQGLKVGQLLPLLAKNSTSELPPAFVKALKRWERNGTEARVEPQTILKVSRPEVLEELRKSKAGRFLGETLGPVTAVVKPGAQVKVLAALAELGLLAEDATGPKEEGHV
jgi:hypothetical protein